MTVFKVTANGRTFFVSTTDADTARALVVQNHPEIDPAAIVVTEEPRAADEFFASADGDAP